MMIRCDMAGCERMAKHIEHTARANTGEVVSYWCDEHKPTIAPLRNKSVAITCTREDMET